MPYDRDRVVACHHGEWVEIDACGDFWAQANCEWFSFIFRFYLLVLLWVEFGEEGERGWYVEANILVV